MMTHREVLLATTEKLVAQQRELLLFTIENLATSIELRDTYTGKHCQRVASFAILLGRQLHLPEKDLEWIRAGALLHDIGKIGSPDDVLRKRDRLTMEEFEIMKSHTTKGAEIVKLVPDLGPIVPIVRSHHERWDGNGYPDGLKGEGIPRLARIVAVANAFDAMVFDTIYRQGRPVEIAFAEIERELGRQFDAEIGAAFLQMREKVVEACALGEAQAEHR